MNRESLECLHVELNAVAWLVAWTSELAVQRCNRRAETSSHCKVLPYVTGRGPFCDRQMSSHYLCNYEGRARLNRGVVLDGGPLSALCDTNAR